MIEQQAWLSESGWISYPFTSIIYFPLVTEFSDDLLLAKIRWHTEGDGNLHSALFALGMITLILRNKITGRILKSTHNIQSTIIKENENIQSLVITFERILYCNSFYKYFKTRLWILPSPSINNCELTICEPFFSYGICNILNDRSGSWGCGRTKWLCYFWDLKKNYRSTT